LFTRAFGGESFNEEPTACYRRALFCALCVLCGQLYFLATKSAKYAKETESLRDVLRRRILITVQDRRMDVADVEDAYL
jgi:hypothetical protein